MGATTLDDIALWSDTIIAESDFAQDPFIDLSFARNRHPLTVLGKLDSLSLHIGTLDVLPGVLGLAHKKLMADPEYGKALARALHQIGVNHRYNVPPELRKMWWFDDAYHLASVGVYETEDAVLEDLLRFTQQFEGHLGQMAVDMPHLFKLDSRLRGNDD